MLTIINNPTAMGARNNLNVANAALGKTISQLSSGLRINSAADDASGLAVSEKLRGQIKGLSKAASNAQDAISMLQTAEGAMGSMTNILQRMRELAVQAGDPAYTTNDRAMLQLEVDQLKSEINRISDSTEFNTKKLLNGDAAGVWSSSSANLEAIMRGAPAEGNYKIETYAAGGQNEIQKSQVMKTKAGVQVAEAVNYDKAAGVVAINNVRGMLATEDGGGNVGLRVNVGAAIVAHASKVGAYTGGVNNGVASAFVTAGVVISGGKSGYIEFYSESGRVSGSRSVVQARFIDAATGVAGEWKNIQITSAGATSGSVTLADNVKITGGATFNGTAKVAAGSRALFAVSSAAGASAAGTSANIQVVTNTTKTAATTASAGYTMRVTNAVSGGGDTTHKIYTGQINSSNGTVMYGSMDITLAKNTTVTATEVLSAAGSGLRLNISKDQAPASRWTTLGELANFNNASGVNVLEFAQNLDIYGGNGKKATISLEGTDTIKDLEDKLTAAIVDQLGLGSTDAIVNQNLVNFVETPTASTNESVKGTFVIQAATVGANSKLSFVGDQNLLNGLGLNILQSNKDSEAIIKVTDAHSGKVIGEDKVSDNILRNVIQGVDVKVNPAADGALNANYNATSKTINFTSASAGNTAYLHVKSNATTAAIGANQGQTLDISIGRMDTVSMEIDDLVVATFNDSQKAITKVDRAVEMLSKARATAGSQINRMNYTITNLNNARENLTAAESRLRDLDIAQASSDLTSQQVRLQAASAMLAQANQLPSYAAQLLK